MARIEIPIVVLNPIAPYNPVAGATVSVLKRSGGAATVYVDESGATTRLQPLITDAQGRVQGWVDRQSYECQITIPGRPVYSEYLDAGAASDGSIDTAWLGNLQVTSGKIASGAITSTQLGTAAVKTANLDQTANSEAVTGLTIRSGAVTGPKIAPGAVTSSHLAPGAVTGSALASNVVPIGTVVDWWRPNTATTVPTGWAVCDGSPWSAIANDMSLASGNIPNLIGKVTMGARLSTIQGGSTPADGLASGNGDGYTNAPGIGGTGGSNASKDFSHTHTITHTHSVPSHAHSIPLQGFNTGGAGSHSHVFELPLTVSGANNHYIAFTSLTKRPAGTGRSLVYATATLEPLTQATLLPYIDNTDGVGDHVHSVPSHDHSGSTGFSATLTTGPASADSQGANWVANPGIDFRPAHVGLLKIMKVRNI